MSETLRGGYGGDVGGVALALLLALNKRSCAGKIPDKEFRLRYVYTLVDRIFGTIQLEVGMYQTVFTTLAVS